MITLDKVFSIEKQDIHVVADTLGKDDIAQLIAWLSEKNDKIRYPSFLLLHERSLHHDDVYPYWDVFEKMLSEPNSFQRNIGLNLIACNAAWDDTNRMENTIDGFLALLYDPKPVTIRQCIQALDCIVSHKAGLHDKITQKLISLDLMNIRESMRKLVLFDILNILVMSENIKAQMKSMIIFTAP